MTSETALLIATAVHLGFQVTVTLLVYPALARVPAGQWATAHDRHSRTITPMVAVVYGALLVTGGWALLSGPGGWTLVALASIAATWLATVFAALIHGRLGAGHDRAQVTRLLRVDRVRAVTATLALAAAVLATR